MSKIKIAIADDYKIFREGLKVGLSADEGLEVLLEADNGEELLKGLETQTPDVIIMDLKMPIMDGLEATRIIRRNGKKQPVIIALTANAMQGDQEECLRAGMDDYLSKPIKLEELVKMLEKWYVQKISNESDKPLGMAI